ncbi:MAG: DUF3006 domain-containing protein [Tissierellia bacterium]|nr:DUF3006 domain-containing protein [Tissierellia bacterium]
MKGIIDRLEGDKVLLEIEDDGVLVFDRELFPNDIKEGDIVYYVKDRFITNKEETGERREYINSLFRSLIEKDDK